MNRLSEYQGGLPREGGEGEEKEKEKEEEEADVALPDGALSVGLPDSRTLQYSLAAHGRGLKINHENICCLNTLLLLLLLARRHGDLQDVLKRVSQLADQRVAPCDQRIPLSTGLLGRRG